MDFIAYTIFTIGLAFGISSFVYAFIGINTKKKGDKYYKVGEIYSKGMIICLVLFFVSLTVACLYRME